MLRNDCPCEKNCPTGCPCYSYGCDAQCEGNSTKIFEFPESDEKIGLDFRLELNQGTIVGKQFSRRGVQIFSSVPYAKAPVGNGRWEAPQIKENWSGELETKSIPPMCHQMSQPEDTLEEYEEKVEKGLISEDCLYLHIERPINGTNLPIFIFIHGGGFVTGTTTGYITSEMAKRGAIVVLPQYRLGTLGFLNTYDEQGPTKYGGNWGLLDQKMAIEFIIENAEALGGNPERVTIAGESAGGWSVGNLLMNTELMEHVHQAISHSGVVFFDMMNQHTSAVNDFIKQIFSHVLPNTTIPDEMDQVVDQLKNISASELSFVSGLLYQKPFFNLHFYLLQMK